VRTEAGQIRPSSRATMGVRLVNLADDVELLAIDKNVESEGVEEAQAVAKGEKTIDEVQEAQVQEGQSKAEAKTEAEADGDAKVEEE